MSQSGTKSGWRKGFGADQVIQRVRPEYSHEYLNNPHKGTTTFQRFQGEPLYPELKWSDTDGPVQFQPAGKSLPPNPRYMPYTRISYCRWPWAVLEPEKGKFRWDIIDRSLEAARARRQTLQVRVQPYTSHVESVGPDVKHGPRERSVNLPPWYWATGARWCKGSYAPNEPDSNDPRYIRHFGDILRAFGKRYDGHPVLESFDMAYAGFWGECGGNSTPKTAAALTDIYLSSFRKTPLLSMLGTDGCTYAAGLKDRIVGWRADCYGDCRTEGGGAVPDGLRWNHMLDAYPKEVELCGVKDAWKSAPVTFETCWTVAYWHKQKWDVDWIIDQGYKYHVSVFMPKSVYFPERWMGKMMEFEKRMGYRFHLHQMMLPLEAKPGQKIKVDVTIDNRGIAPIYRPYAMALRFSQGKNHRIVRLKQDIRTWLPDFTYFSEPITFPRQLTRGEVKVATAIVNERNEPVVKFAIRPLANNEWHPLTSMDAV